MKAAGSRIIDRPGRTRRGFNLIEGMVGVSVLAIATTAIVIPISAAIEHTRHADQSLTAATLARQLIEEIASKPFRDPLWPSSGPGPEPGETTRAAFSNVDDYHGYTDSTTTLIAINGVSTALPTERGVFTRSVTVAYRDSPNGTPVSRGDFALVTVTVTMPSGQTVSVHRLFSDYARN